MFKILLTLFFLLLSACSTNSGNLKQQAGQVPEPPSSEVTPIKSTNNQISTYSTKLTDKTPNRLHNIKLGASILDGTTVKSGETFSFNDTIGPRTGKTGFKEAIIFDGHGNKIQGYGGGICQLSSTLYNTVLGAGITVDERHEHSKDVPYVNAGDDATVSYASEDFKFTNNLQKTITIKVDVLEDKLTVSLY